MGVITDACGAALKNPKVAADRLSEPELARLIEVVNKVVEAKAELTAEVPSLERAR